MEDLEDDALFMKLALEAAGVKNTVVLARDGREALEYLSGAGKYAERREHPLPYLILLDLKLPYVMGLDVLKWLREKPEFDATVVIPLSASASPVDIDEAYRLGANAYLVKPPSFAKLKVMAQAIKDFWLVENQPGFGGEI